MASATEEQYGTLKQGKAKAAAQPLSSPLPVRLSEDTCNCEALSSQVAARPVSVKSCALLGPRLIIDVSVLADSGGEEESPQLCQPACRGTHHTQLA